MPYIPLQKEMPSVSPLMPQIGGYIPLTEIPPVGISVAKPITSVPVYETAPKLPAETIKEKLSFLEPTTGENVGVKALKWLGRMVISPFTPLIQDVAEIHAANEISKGVASGKYDFKIFDELEVLQKKPTQIVGDVSQVVIAFTPLKAMEAIKGLPVLSKMALTTMAKTGAGIGAAFGAAQVISEKPEPTPTELVVGTGIGAIGGALVMPLFGTVSRGITNLIKLPFRAGVAEKPSFIEKVFPKLYEKRMVAEGVIEKEAPKLNVGERLLKYIIPQRQLLQKDTTASYIGLKSREITQEANNIFRGIMDSPVWDTIKKTSKENWGKIIDFQESKIVLAEKGIIIPPRAQEVINLRNQKLTYEEIGKRLGYSVEKVRQIETQAVKGVKEVPIAISKEFEKPLNALRTIEEITHNLSKQAGADVEGWRFTPENHYPRIWTGSQTIVEKITDPKTGKESLGKIFSFAKDRAEGVEKLLKAKTDNPNVDIVMRPRADLYLRNITPTQLSQKSFFKLAKQIANVMESNVDDIFEELNFQGIAKIKSSKSFIGQWQFRKGDLVGYEKDPTKVYPSLIYRLVKRAYIDPEVRKMALKLNNIKDGEIKDIASNLLDTVSGKYQRQLLSYSLTGKITGIQAQMKLGGRVSPAIVNLFQRLYGVGITGEKNFAQAQRMILTKEGQNILQRIGVSTEVPLYEGKGTTRKIKWYNPLKLFGETEGGKYVGNRNNVAMAGYLKGLELPFKRININLKNLKLPIFKNQEDLAVSFARNLVDATQFRYDIVDLPMIFRNNLGKTLFQFKSYGLNQLSNVANILQGKPLAGLELFYPQGLTKTQAFHQAIVFFGTMFSQGGIRALGFGLERVLPASVLVWLSLHAPVLLYGITSLLGIDVSRSATVELANLTQLLPIEDAKKVWTAIQKKDPEQLLSINPAALRIYKGLEAIGSGGYLKDIETEAKILKLKPTEIGLYILGVNPLRVSQEQDTHYFYIRTKQEADKLVSQAKLDLSSALKNKDWELAKNILANLKKHNLEIRASDLEEHIKRSELPRLLRDYLDYRKSLRPQGAEIIKEFYEQK